MDRKYFYASSLRLTRFLYALGFDYAKEDIFDRNGNQRWRFDYSDELAEAYEWFKYMRVKVRNTQM